MKRHWQLQTLCFYGIALIMVVVSLISLASALSWVNKPFAGFLIYEFPRAGSMGLSDWPGPEKGVKYLDRVITVDGQPVREGRDVVKALRQKDPGTSVHYVLESKGQVREVSIPATVFNLKDFLLVFFVPFLGGLALYALGVIVYVLKPKVSTSWVFYILCFSLGSYMVTGVEMQSSYFLVHFHYVIFCLFPPTFIHLGLIFPDRKQFLNRFPKLEYAIYMPALILELAYQTYLFNYPGIISGSALSWLPNYKQIGTVNRFFTLFCVAGLVVLVLHNTFKASTSLARQRARVILFGVTIAFLPAAIITLLVFTIKINFPWNFLVFFVIFFPASIAYSIVRHNLFDADTIIRRTVGYAVVTAVVVGAYALVSVSFNILLGKYQLAQSRAFPILFTLGVILVFNPLRSRIQSLVDRLFFRKEYNYQEIVQKISETMRSLLNQDQICKSIMKFALEPMFVDSGSVMILSKDKTEYECFIQTDEKQEPERDTSVGFETTLTAESVAGEDVSKEMAVVETAPENTNLILSTDDPLMRKLAELKKEVTLYDILEDPFFEDDRKACENAFERLGAILIVPLIYEDRLTGLISLGQKKSGKFYRRDDINLLNTLAGQGALAVENARMVEEIVEKERMRTKIMDAFGKYVTPEVRDQILEGNIPLDGEAKEVTVLFADLRDFTTLAESTTPKEVVRIINGYFSEMADAIGQNHGLVLQFIGDEIEAVFGAPMPLEDHPTHAFRAALAMRERLVVVNEKLKQQGYGPLRHGIGIHTGSVVAANIGSEDRLSYAMVGDTVNLASRIQGLNKEFGTDLLISATTVERLVDDIEVEKLPATTVKGKREPVEVYRIAQTL